MSRRLAALRVLFVVAAVSGFAACASPTAPTSRNLTIGAPNHDGEIIDTTCRSGWSNSNGRC